MSRKTKRTKNEVNAVIPENQSIVAPKKARQCEHIMTNGEFCRGVALRGRHYCFFHLSYVGRRLRDAQVHDRLREFHLDEALIPMELPLLEDANSIQIALTQVVNALLHHRIDTKRAGLALYALQIARSNLANGVGLESGEGATVAGRYDNFEQDYQLPNDVPELKVDEAEQEEELPIDAAPTVFSEPISLNTGEQRCAPTRAKEVENVRGPARTKEGATARASTAAENSARAGKKPPAPERPPARHERPARPQFLEITPWLVQNRKNQTAAVAVASGGPSA